jgi:hypothetical protein
MLPVSCGLEVGETESCSVTTGSTVHTIEQRSDSELVDKPHFGLEDSNVSNCVELKESMQHFSVQQSRNCSL